jgi:stalled ribosome rescue protein Dom34
MANIASLSLHHDLWVRENSSKSSVIVVKTANESGGKCPNMTAMAGTLKYSFA